MKSLMLFLKAVLEDLEDLCYTSTRRDLKTIALRIEHEGVSFLTITLAKFGVDFDKSLSQGFVGNDQFTGFARTEGLPRFLGGFLSQVFDRSTGRLLDEPSIAAIWAIRQLTLMWAKIELDCSEERVKAAFRQYVECEKDLIVNQHLLVMDPGFLDSYRRIGRLLWTDVLAKVNEDVYYDRIVPQHGPGATADSLRGNAKWAQQVWHRRLEEVFPHWIHLTSSESLSFEKLDGVEILEPEAEMPVKVITVPKTLKAPRIIAVEPTCMQYMQQGILSSLTRALEQSDTCSQLINGPSQIPNREMARRGSLTGDLATLDLSEASDRVLNLHVRVLTENHSHLQEAVDAVRSRKADVPGHGVIHLTKYASMGSALTFPLEAMVFMTIVFCGIERELSRQLTEEDVQSFLGSVRVYGDDIIIPVDFVESVIDDLEAHGLKVNSDKSHWTGNFRESCGGDYFKGHDISIVRLRSMFPTSRSDAREIISTVSTRNLLYKQGMWRSVRFIDDLLERFIPLPMVTEESPVLGRVSYLGYETQRTHPDTQSPLVKGYVVRNSTPASLLDDYSALLKCLTFGDPLEEQTIDHEYLPVLEEGHLERSGRPQRVSTSLRWASPF